MTEILAAGDPLFSRGVDLTVVLIVMAKTVVVFGAMLVSVLLLIWFERKLVADMQDRIGPARAGPFGVLQTLADGIKLFFKEDLLPSGADRRVFRLAPYLATVPAFLSFAIVPVGGMVTIAGRQTRLQLADPPIGILFLLAMSSVAVYGVMLAGWSSGSKYPLLGAVRGSAQMVSYEAALGLSTVAVVLVTGSLLTSDIVAAQSGSGFAFLPNWNVLRLGFIPFIVFFIAGTAEANRPPFDLVEAEQELVGGFHTEYSSLRFALFFLAEFMNTITMSAIMVTLFLGGPTGPGPDSGVLGAILPVFWFLVKVFGFLCVYIWLRATLPRFRYDQLMDLGWKKLIPGSLVWLLVLAAFQVNQGLGIAVTAGGLVMGALLWRAMQVGQDAGEYEIPAPPAYREAP
ncbi:MAG: NADH-quinone oxidoreductase subunit NuoH [Actinomycetota bacterium]|nr:NADH-quinone oxidoreductase subunit NuoH [Actinomycetota bacterium]